MNTTDIKISEYDYDLPDERIAKFPASSRDGSKLLIYRDGRISGCPFASVAELLPEDSLLAFNNTKVIRARMIMRKPSGARIEIFCLEPHDPADYERAFAVKGSCQWKCIVGNSKKWKEGPLEVFYPYEGRQYKLQANRCESQSADQIVRFEWESSLTFGQVLEVLGRIPIPPYLGRESEKIDDERYQTVYSKIEGSVAAPTAGLHFTDEILSKVEERGIAFAEVTLHVGAGTFMPVKTEAVREHPMHTEHFEVNADTLSRLIDRYGRITAVGTTTVRTLESLTGLGYREVATLIENLYSKLKLMLLKRGDDSKSHALLTHLRKIDEHMRRKGTRFLTGDTMCCFDCELMPRLQHIRVAGAVQ